MKENYKSWSIPMNALFRSHDLWEIVSNGYVELTEEQVKDIFTKALPTNSFTKLRTKLGMKAVSV